MENSVYPSNTHHARNLASQLSTLYDALDEIVGYVGQIRFMAATVETAIARFRERIELLEEKVLSPLRDDSTSR